MSLNVKVNRHVNRALLYWLIMSLLLYFTVVCSVFAQERVMLLQVVSGDVLKVLYHDREEYVRLIGIETPDSQYTKDNVKLADNFNIERDSLTILGKKAVHFLNTLMKSGDYLIIEFDDKSRDEFDTLVAYVYLVDGRMINELVLREGYGYLDVPSFSGRYADILTRAQRSAQENERGLWRKRHCLLKLFLNIQN